MDIDKTFSGKTVFFTGVTGFVGKVFLWKLLKEFPDLGGAICLIRTKKGQKPQDRLQKGVLSSECFKPLRKQIGEEEWQRRAAKVIAVSGDICDDKLGMSEEDYQMVASRTNHIVHMAATVNFDERLDLSVKMNVLGSMRVMALAEKCPNLDAYVHMSTCYVNYQRHDTVVRETLYPLPFDAEDMCKYILAQTDPKVIELVTNRLLKQYNYPNTYTLTKSIGEHILHRRKGNLPLSIIRPAIVGCAWKEPMPGWVDALTAAGGIFLTAGLGILREMFCKHENKADLVPVDFVVATTIKLLHRTATFYHGRKAEAGAGAPRAIAAPSVNVTGASVKGGAADVAVAAASASAQQQVQAPGPSSASSTGTNDNVGPTMPFVYQSCTSSSLNAMRWQVAHTAVIPYWNAHPHPKAIGPAEFTFMPSWWSYRVRFIALRVIPVMGMKAAASLPYVGSPQRKKLITRLEKAIFRSADLQRQFLPFMTNEWTFDNTNSAGLDEYVLPEQQKRFECDTFDINWHAYVEMYSYGMVKYIMKTDDGRPMPTVPASGREEFLKASL